MTRTLTAALIILASFLTGCQENLPDSSAAQTATVGAVNTLVAGTQAALGLLPSATHAATPTLPTSSTTTPNPPTVTPGTHTLIPGEPGQPGLWIWDRDNSTTASQKRAHTGDHYLKNLFERPFTAAGMTYRPDVDIIRGDLTRDDTFYYALITLQGVNPVTQALTAHYGVELDTDIDGRGDFLLWVAPPFASEWTTASVQAFADANNDIGGKRPLQAEAPPASSDGYETRLFPGDDPDLVWVRIAPANPAQIQIAFKPALIGKATAFLWGVLADDGLKDPARMEYSDRFTLAEAGSPLISLTEYPIKALELVDNTCRVAFGFTPLGNEPGLCSR